MVGENPLNRSSKHLNSKEHGEDIVCVLSNVKTFMTISYGGILSCKVIGINLDYTMSISLLDLKSLAADFDGDTLNILYMYNQDFIKLADRIISPRQMFISRNDGRCNSDFIHSRDIIINANSLKNMYSYTQNQVDRINELMAMGDVW